MQRLNNNNTFYTIDNGISESAGGGKIVSTGLGTDCLP